MSLILSSCSSSSNVEPPSGETEYIRFGNPTSGSDYSTDRPIIDMDGVSYPSSSAQCTSIFGGTISPDYQVTWHNSANNVSGTASVGLSCLISGYVVWKAYYIPLELGANKITVRVIDPGDGVDGSSSMMIYRIADTTPPEVTSISPDNDATNVSVSRTVSVSFNEKMDINSLNTATFVLEDQSQNIIAGSVSYSNFDYYTATFTPDSPLNYSTTYTAKITTGAKDFYGNNGLLADYSWSFTTRSDPDVISPSVINTSPVQNSYCAGVNSPVTATFDEAINPSTLNSNSFYLQDGLGDPVEAILSYTDPVVSLQPQTVLSYNSAYTATLTQTIADHAGNTMATDYVLNFSTVANEGSGNWVSTSTNGAPIGLDTPVAVWTGDKMIVWGLGIIYDSVWERWISSAYGGAYDPVTDSWSNISNVNDPSDRLNASAVWTGTEMIIWGGNLAGSAGAAYNPSTDSWRTISSVGSPSGRRFHNAVWTGSEMIIWGGANSTSALSDGARYDPVDDSWTAMSNTNAPNNGVGYTNNFSMVWTGSQVILWNSWGPEQSARYNPVTDSWSTISTINAPTNFSSHRSVWTGSEMLVWGESLINSQFGFRYDPVTDSWSNMSMLCGLDSRSGMEAIWTGTNMAIWGGGINNGAIYSPSTDSWEMMNITNAPMQRREHTMVWTGSKAIVWGGLSTGNSRLNSGGIFYP
jgi:N-acetylneuraminic acid mutarotase